MRKLKIAQIAPFWYDVPPKEYGGTERVVYYITEELVRRGHDVTLIASEDSVTKAKLISPFSSKYLQAIKFYSDVNYNAINTYVNSFVFKHASDFDIIHSHASYFSFYFSDFIKTPSVHTIHNQLPRINEPENEIFRKYRHLNFISISNEFRSHFDLNYVATVYHGLPLDFFPFNEVGGDNLFWIGRASKHKGEIDAIETAKKIGKILILALSIKTDNQDYFNNFVKPLLSPNIKVVFNLRFEDIAKYYGPSKVFIFPVQWKEPFGLILIESMACGTPVVAYARGSIPEIIKDGETGFIVNPSDEDIRGDWIVKKTGIDGLCEAVEKIYSMPEAEYKKMRRACRDYVEKRFTVERMIDNYEKIYFQLLNKR